MANQFYLIEKYMKDAIDSVFVLESKTKILENGGKFIDVNFQEAGYVKVMSLLMDGLSDYYRVNNQFATTGENYAHYSIPGQGHKDGYRVGSTQNSWEIFKLEYDRGKQFQVDNMDNEETASLIIGNLLTEFLKTKVVPEIDATRFSKIAGKANATLGNLTTLTVDTTNAQTSGSYINALNGVTGIIHRFNEAFEWLTEHEVPEEEQVIFVNPAIMTLIRNTAELVKFITQGDYKLDNGINFTVEKYMGKPIIEVPSNRFFTNVQVGDNGYYAGTNSKVINFMVVSKKAIIPIVKLNKSKIWTPETVQDFDGYKVNFRLYHDSIIPKNKVPGVYVCVGTAAGSTKSNLLSVAISAGTATNSWKVDEYYTNPAGLMGQLIVKYEAATVGDKVDFAKQETTLSGVGSAGEFFVVEKGVELADSSSATHYFALIDASGNIVASTGTTAIAVN